MNDRTVQAARNGDRAALASLLRELADSWFRFALSLLGNAEQARDATQETGLRFLKAIPAFRGDSQLQTWSLGIALNVVREMHRKSRAIPQDRQDYLAMLREPPLSPHVSAQNTEQREVLHAVLANLPDRQREAIVLRFFEELSVEETAAAMNCAEGTVKATVHQALRSMRQKLPRSFSPVEPPVEV